VQGVRGRHLVDCCCQVGALGRGRGEGPFISPADTEGSLRVRSLPSEGASESRRMVQVNTRSGSHPSACLQSTPSVNVYESPNKRKMLGLGVFPEVREHFDPARWTAAHGLASLFKSPAVWRAMSKKSQTDSLRSVHIFCSSLGFDAISKRGRIDGPWVAHSWPAFERSLL